MDYIHNHNKGDENLIDFMRRSQQSSDEILRTCKNLEFNIHKCMLGFCMRLIPVPKTSNRLGHEIIQYHADCILPEGKLASYGFDTDDIITYAGTFRERFEKGLTGKVKFNQDNNRKYFNAKLAIKARILTRFLIFSVNRIQAAEFSSLWEQLDKPYNRITNNCSSVPYYIFRKSGIFPKILIPPITPQRLFTNLEDYISSNPNFQLIKGVGFLSIHFDTSKVEVWIPKELSGL